MGQIRLQKAIADSGITSRRKAEKLIEEGRITVNGKAVTRQGLKVDQENDVICLDHNVIDPRLTDKVYIVLNKPRGHMTTLFDPEGRKTVMDLLPNMKERIYPVGRLDYLSEGLLLLTNDGDLAEKITHPKYQITKVYEVKVFGIVTPNLLRKLRKGAPIDGRGTTVPKSVRAIKQLPNKTWLEFRLEEGKNRAIRKICEHHGLTVDKLRRVAIGNLSIQGLSSGHFCFLEKRKILMALGINQKGERTRPVEYLSPKKSLKTKGTVRSSGHNADDKIFHPLKRKTYFQTIERIKAKEQRLLSEKRQREGQGTKAIPS